MKTAIIIPSRMNSQRLYGKPLMGLKGAFGAQKSLVERCWIAAQGLADEIYVATDHLDIKSHVESFGGRALMTPESCRNGTERCAALLDQIDADIFVNFQGDSPLIPADFVEAIVQRLTKGDAQMTTPVMTCSQDQLSALREDRQAGRVGGTTAVIAGDGRALYFSKEVLPFSDKLGAGEVFLHIGLYAYRREALKRYASWPESRLEQIEGLEQLRFLENGAKVECVTVEAAGRAFWEVNLPEDIARVEAALQQRGIA